MMGGAKIELKNEHVVYKLFGFPDIPIYEGFASKGDVSFLGQESFEDNFFFYGTPTTRDWQAPRLASIWKPVEVVGRVRKFNDFPCADTVPAFSERAVDALRDLLEPHGELLPLKSTLGNYYAYNVTTVADVLDVDRSDVDWVSHEHWPYWRMPNWIKHYQFLSDKIAGLIIFRIPEEKSKAFVTQAFVDRATECGLDGFNFIKVWPLPPGVSWKEVYEANSRRKSRKGLPRGRASRGNAVIVRLRLVAAKPSSAEEAEMNRLMDALDAILVDVDAAADASQVGSLEGHEWLDGEGRLFLSCPDADALVKKLWPWLKSLRWEGLVMVLKRYGKIHDASAREEYVDLEGTKPQFKSPVVHERPLTDNERGEVESFAAEARKILELRPETAAADVQAAIHTWLEDFRHRKPRLTKIKRQDKALAMGCLWGETVCKELGWQWGAATLISSNSESYSIAPPKRQCVVFPTDNFFALLGGTKKHVNTPNTLELYENLKSGKVGNGKAKRYEIVD